MNSAFNFQWKKKLGEMIRDVTNKNSKTEETLLNDLKIKQCAVTNLPQIIISDAVLIGNCETKNMCSYMQARIGKINHLEWIDYVERNFDATKVSEIQKRKNIVETSKNKQAETASIPSKVPRITCSTTLVCHNFGSHGPTTQSLQSHPVQASLFKSLDSNGVNRTTVTHNKVTDKVILVLLRTLLAPKREMQRRQNIMELSTRPPREKKIGKNYARNILRVEQKKLIKYHTKGKLESASKAQKRIVNLEQNFKERREVKAPCDSAINTDKNLVLPNDDGTIEGDVTGRRIRQLKALIKNFVFSSSFNVD
ncbi:hypothetical protein EDC94DRAFT_686483 [Helicostylum pulchrum]|nr:hypothetical protein EDC94DRAFT_686483 [Helicostylum pulchrum]